MRPQTRIQYNQYIARVAALNAIEFLDAAQTKFTATPAVEQALFKKVQESSDLLTRINMVFVRDLAAEIIGLGLNTTLAKRTNVATTDRSGSNPTDMNARTYLCKSTEFDSAITWAQLDQWTKFPNFQQLWSALVAERIALDMIMIGFNGTSAATATDRVAHPLLQDVNIGWLEKQRLENAARVLDSGKVAGKITYGDALADYLNLDAMVYDAFNTLMPTWASGRTDLVAIVGKSLLHDKYFPLINRDQDAQNTLASDVIMSTKRLGGLPAAQVPFFPEDAIFITPFKNLSIYIQEESARRKIEENHKRNRVDDYNSSNQAYVIEDLDCAVLIEKIEEYA